MRASRRAGAQHESCRQHKDHQRRESRDEPPFPGKLRSGSALRPNARHDAPFQSRPRFYVARALECRVKQLVKKVVVHNVLLIALHNSFPSATRSFSFKSWRARHSRSRTEPGEIPSTSPTSAENNSATIE